MMIDDFKINKIHDIVNRSRREKRFEFEPTALTDNPVHRFLEKSKY